jgi:hypothetical protein
MTGKCQCHSGLRVMRWTHSPRNTGLSPSRRLFGHGKGTSQSQLKWTTVDPQCQGNREETTVPPMRGEGTV